MVQTFSDPKPVKATLGFTIEGQLALTRGWGDTAATRPHTSGLGNYSFMLSFNTCLQPHLAPGRIILHTGLIINIPGIKCTIYVTVCCKYGKILVDDG